MSQEKLLDNYPSPITIEGTTTILNQMKNCICKIKNEKGKGTGFFCYIPYNNDKLPVMITNYHLINENIINKNKVINVTLNDDEVDKSIIIDENRKIYANETYDTTIIEIRPSKDKINQFLELDSNIFKQSPNLIKESIYIIQYPKFLNEQKASVSYGILKNIQDYNLNHFCSTCPGSSGSPILNLSNNKVLGIHKEASIHFQYNIGTFLKYPIQDYINIIINTIKNEIKIDLTIDKKNVNKNIYFLDNSDYTDEKTNKKHFHDYLSEINESIADLYINNEKLTFKKYFKPIKEGKYTIIVKLKTNITDCSYMFFCCSNITKVDLSSFYSKNVKDMNHMFYWCKNLENIDLSGFNTENVTNMSNLFQYCEKIINLDLSSFNTIKVEKMNNMFHNCKNLNDIHLSSSFDTKNVTDMNQMFYDCQQLMNINLLTFNTKNVKNMGQMFFDCNNLKFLDLSSFEFNDDMDLKYMIFYCDKLEKIKVKKNYKEKIKKNIYNDDIEIIEV